MKRCNVVSAVALVFVGQQAVTAVTHGAPPSNPPPPPPPPVCKSCQGPPPPPVLITPGVVPTLPPEKNPVAATISVQISPSRVRRGHAVTVHVSAGRDKMVTATIAYHRGKPFSYHGRVDSEGEFARSWKVSKAAPIGVANIKVNVEGEGTTYSTTVSFLVNK